ncbi:hypothetical protein ACQJBY_070886 [Aegilops geniculata]
MGIRSRRRARAPAADPPSRRRRREDVRHVHGLPWEVEWRDWAALPRDVLWIVLSLLPQADVLRGGGWPSTSRCCGGTSTSPTTRTQTQTRRRAGRRWRAPPCGAALAAASPSAAASAAPSSSSSPTRTPIDRSRSSHGAIAAEPPRDLPVRRAQQALHPRGGEEAPSAGAARAVGAAWSSKTRWPLSSTTGRAFGCSTPAAVTPGARLTRVSERASRVRSRISDCHTTAPQCVLSVLSVVRGRDVCAGQSGPELHA